MANVNAKNEKVALTVVSKIEKATAGLPKTLSKLLTDGQTALTEITKATESGMKDYQVLLENINTSEIKLEGLKEEYAKKLREANYDLEMKSKENAKLTLDKLAGEFSVELLPAGENTKLLGMIKSLEGDLSKAKKFIDETVKKAVDDAVEATTTKLELEQKATNAVDKAKIDQLENAIKVKDAQISQLEGIISAERERAIKEAEARSGSQVTVNAGK